MIAYKAFHKGLRCRDYQFHMGLNTTDKANCRENGFHCAANPLDCLSYYCLGDGTELYIVKAGGDIDEDEIDSKISCTELTILKKLDLGELLLHALAYMVDHPTMPWNRNVCRNSGTADQGFAIVRGVDPIAMGKRGDYLAFAKELPDGSRVSDILVVRVDGEKIAEDTYYNFMGRKVIEPSCPHESSEVI